MSEPTAVVAPPEIDLEANPETREEAFALVRAWARSDHCDRMDDRSPEDLAGSLRCRTAMARAAARRFATDEEDEEDTREGYFEVCNALTAVVEDTICALRRMGALQEAERLLGGFRQFHAAAQGNVSLEELDQAVADLAHDSLRRQNGTGPGHA